MEEKWKEIPEFPNYSVSSHGRICRNSSGRILKQSANNYGVVFVGMMREGRQRHRSVALLVAKAFIPHRFGAFDTPINLDGDRHNNHVDNLVWRPHWFAVKYNRQFRHPYPNPINAPIENIKTGEVTDGSFETAMRYGILEQDLVLSIVNRTYVWPGYMEFRVLE